MIAPVAQSPAPSGAPTPGKPSSLGALDGDAFMRLLVEQMRAQDPTEPQSATEFVAQLATFAGVEQQVGIRDALDAMRAADALDAAALVGRTVTGPDGEGGRVASVRLTNEGAVATLATGGTVRIGPGVTVAG